MNSSNNNRRSGIDWSEYGGLIGFFGFIALICLVVFWGNITSVISGGDWDTNVAMSCDDVTSYDRNWDNDMLCTRSDSSTFYTDYAGARKAVQK
jgi:hypothetical protein